MPARLEKSRVVAPENISESELHQILSDFHEIDRCVKVLADRLSNWGIVGLHGRITTFHGSDYGDLGTIKEAVMAAMPLAVERREASKLRASQTTPQEPVEPVEPEHDNVIDIVTAREQVDLALQ